VRGGPIVRLAAPSAVALLVLLAAGCGGGQSEAERWMDDVCSSVGDWRDQVTTIGQDVVQQARDGTLDENALRDAVEQARDETNALADELQNAGPPPVEEGEGAQQQLGEVTENVTALLEGARTKVSGENPSASTYLDAASDVVDAADQVVAGVQQVADRAGELRTAFDDTDSCQDLRG